MMLSLLVSWAFLVSIIPQALPLSDPATAKPTSATPSRTVLESKFLLSDYGWTQPPRKLSKREQLALALTQCLDGGQ